MLRVYNAFLQHSSQIPPPFKRRYRNINDAATSTFPPPASRSAIACSLSSHRDPSASRSCPPNVRFELETKPPLGLQLVLPSPHLHPSAAQVRSRAYVPPQAKSRAPTAPQTQTPPPIQTRSRRRRRQPPHHPQPQGSAPFPGASAPRGPTPPGPVSGARSSRGRCTLGVPSAYPARTAGRPPATP